ncbi:MAG TPA: phosphoribosylformylglycinamidine cyclo-ligase [Longimicrobiales bacterium]|nr:phosphoribosylformylglycinamidine cyclo-ligase [Longimicrobiales bacterium]
MSRALSYRDAGVDLEAAERAKERLKELVASTRDRYTLSELGHFGGLYRVPPDLSAPVLVSSADGVGTKLKVAFSAKRHDSVGQCLVNHCVNDILVQGARPLFFLDYLATGVLDEEVVREVVRGVAVACKENGCALLGGETAQMPGFYADGEYDLAGFVVGVVERDGLIDGSRIRAGDVLVGLASSGLHTNGYTLARRIVFDEMGLGVGDELPGTGRSVADELLSIHRSYLSTLSKPLAGGVLRGLAHITGGGIPGNLPRVLPEGLGARVVRSSWEVPPVFDLLQRAGSVPVEEMDRVFNMGVGMIAVVEPDAAHSVVDAVAERGVEAWVIGSVIEGGGVSYA